MSVLDRFLPPPGAPGAIRDGVAAWRSAADRVEQVARELRGRTATASAGWHGSASDAFSTTSMSFLGQVAQAAGLLHRSGDLLDAWADRVEEAQTEYHRRIGLVVGTGVVFGAFTLVTAGASDVAGSAAVGMELAAVTEGLTAGAGLLASDRVRRAGRAAGAAGRGIRGRDREPGRRQRAGDLPGG